MTEENKTNNEEVLSKDLEPIHRTNGITVKKNMLWGLLNDGSKLAIVDLLKEEGFKGEVKLVGVIKGDTTVIKVESDQDIKLELAINILDILNS